MLGLLDIFWRLFWGCLFLDELGLRDIGRLNNINLQYFFIMHMVLIILSWI